MRETVRPFLMRAASIAAVVLASGVCAQPVHVTTQVFPPLSPHVSDWISQQGKMLVTLQSMAGSPVYSVRLAFTISGDNGVSVYTKPNYLPPSPITLNPGVPVTLTVADISNYFSLQQLQTVKVTMQELTYGNGLPEGTYSVCVRALDYQSGSPLSSVAPGGCSAPFQVAYVEPPTIINPSPDQIIDATGVQNVVFSWTVPAGAPPGVEYVVKLAEVVPDSRDPNDALNAATTPAFFERTTVAPTLLYGPADPLLVKGRRYALRVQVRDPQNRVVFQNGGRSAVIAFRYGTKLMNVTATATGPTVTAAPATPSVNAEPSFSSVLPVSSVNGVLKYRYNDGTIAGAWPLADMPMKLVLEYVLKNTALGDYVLAREQLDYSLPGLEPDTLAVTTSTADGSFSFAFISPDSMGLMQSDVTVDIGSGKEFVNEITGDLWRVARIILPTDYYCSPDNEIVVQPNAGASVQALASVKTYSAVFTATVWQGGLDDSEVSTLGNLAGVDVFVLRKQRPLAVPDNEGFPKLPEPLQLFDMDVIARERTDADGKAEFKALVKNVGPNDKYYVYVHSDSTQGDKHYASFLTQFRFSCASVPTTPKPGQIYVDTADSTISWESFVQQPRVYTEELHVVPKPPRVAGRVYRGDNPMKPIAGAHVKLRRSGVLPTTEAWTTTSDSGAFVIVFEPDSYDKSREYYVTISYPGFKTARLSNIGSLVMGSQYTAPTVLLEPLSKVYGSVVDDDSCGVEARVRIGEGAEKGTGEPLVAGQYYSTIDAQEFTVQLSAVAQVYEEGDNRPPRSLRQAVRQASDQVSVTASQTPAANMSFVCPPPRHFLLPAIPGTQKLYIIPEDLTRYFPETLSVNVTKDLQELGRFTVHKRAHRMRFRVVEYSAPTMQVTPQPGFGMHNSQAEPGTGGASSSVQTMQQLQPTQQSGPVANVSPQQQSYGAVTILPALTGSGQAEGTGATPIAGAVVTVNGQQSLTTGQNGITDMYRSFSSATEFVLDVRGPDNKDYVPRFGIVINHAISKTLKEVTIALLPGGRVSGTVYIDSTPLPGARVFLSGSSDSAAITDDQGRFTLRRVPLMSGAIITATRAPVGDTTFVGASDTIDVTPTVDGVVLRLRICNELDISSLLGFPVELTHLKLTSSRSAVISGLISDVPANPRFALAPEQQNQPIAFTNIAVEGGEPGAGGKPKAVPVKMPVPTDVNTVALKASDAFKARLYGGTGGLRIDTSAGDGLIAGRVSIEASSFQYQAPFQFTRLFLARPDVSGAARMRIPALSASGNAPLAPAQALLAVDSGGADLRFRLNDFEATASSEGSLIRNDTIRLPVTLHAHTNHLPAQDFPIGDLLLRRTGYRLVRTTDSLTIPLEKWHIIGTDWSVNQGFVVNSGVVRTGVIEIPFIDLRMTPAQMNGTFSLTSLPIGPSSTLHVSGTPHFGFDEGRGRWALAVTPTEDGPAASFGGLPGMTAGDRVDIDNFYLLSDGRSLFTIDQQTPTLTVHKVARFT
ncbi:MAG: hypothetical protein GF331_07635, partial [Chitinivibrionales bacterium]|nr:hypothetical protein [Chitinivibrionales bacterium]